MGLSSPPLTLEEPIRWRLHHHPPCYKAPIVMGSSSTLERLPPELQASIQSWLSSFDIKRLRLASRKCNKCFQLPADRVCLSANSRNIQALLAIADHPIYRLKVQELVWDDARLLRKPTNRGRWPDDSDGRLGRLGRRGRL